MMDDPMPFAFFTVPVRDSNAAVEDLNRLMASRRILSVDRRWVDVGPDSFWSICVDYLDGSQPKSSTAQLRGKVDYKEILKPEEFALFAKLRDWRKGVSSERSGSRLHDLHQRTDSGNRQDSGDNKGRDRVDRRNRRRTDRKIRSGRLISYPR
jgi:hypothetical protein